MIPLLRFSKFLAILLLSFSLNDGWAQDEEASEEPGHVQVPVADTTSKVILRLKIIRSDEVVSNNFSVIAEIENKTLKVLNASELQIVVPPRLAYYYTIPQFAKRDIKSKSKVVQELNFVRTNEGSAMFSVNKVTFIPGDYEMTFVLKYADAGISTDRLPKNPRVVSSALRVSFRPPLTSLLAGGVIGSFLLAIFYLIFTVRRDVEGKKFELSRLAYPVTNAAIMFVFGSVVSVIMILIVQRVSDFTLPISIKIEDYLGGIIVGMLSTKAGDSMYDFLLKPDTK
jgi:hypothetical protein